MLRTTLARLAFVAACVSSVGCGLFNNNRNNGCNTCGDERPGFFSRFRLASNNNHGSQGVVISDGGCCNGCGEGAPVTGPYLPPAVPPGNVLPPANPSIPRIDENGKQMPWDPKTSRPRSTAEVRANKEGA
jgi:hypothetical protein